MLRGKADARSEDETERELLAIDERYIRRDEVRELAALMTEMNLEMSSHFDKLNTLAARLRKRDQRAVGPSNGGGDPHDPPAEPPNGDPTASRVHQKAELRRQISSIRR